MGKLKHTETHWNTLTRIAMQYTATHYNTLRHIATIIIKKGATSEADCSVLQYVASN